MLKKKKNFKYYFEKTKKVIFFYSAFIEKEVMSDINKRYLYIYNLFNKRKNNS